MKADSFWVLLRALTAVAEESEVSAEAGRHVWPALTKQLIDLHNEGRRRFNDRHYGSEALAALIPTPIYDSAEFLYREMENTAMAWSDVTTWQTHLDLWIPVATGRARCVDSLIFAIETLPMTDQVQAGLPWVRALALSSPGTMAQYSHSIDRWLAGIRPTADENGHLDSWQELVDALVVAGDRRLAPYSE